MVIILFKLMLRLLACFIKRMTATYLPVIGHFYTGFRYCSIVCQTVAVDVIQSIAVRKVLKTVARFL